MQDGEFFSVEPNPKARHWGWRLVPFGLILVVFMVLMSMLESTPQLSGNYNGYLGSSMSSDKIGFQCRLEQVGKSITGQGILSRQYAGKQIDREVTFQGKLRGNRVHLVGTLNPGSLELDGNYVEEDPKQAGFHWKIMGNGRFINTRDSASSTPFLLHRLNP